MSLYTSATYRRGPLWTQELLLSVRGSVRRWIRSFGQADLASQIERFEHFDAEAVTEIQLLKVRATLEQAAKYVPFYRKRFAEIGFDPRDLTHLRDLQRIPELTKLEALSAGHSLLSERHWGPRYSALTSGTTGTPMRVWRDLSIARREQAFINRQLRWAGVKDGDSRVWLRGDKVVPLRQRTPPYWRLSRGDNTLLMSSYHLSASSSSLYIEEMGRFDPKVIVAYPSSILLLARSLANDGNRYRGRRLRAIITSSETLTSEHRGIIEGAFRCRIFNFYGSAERVVCIGTCESGKYHLMSDYGYAEFAPCADGSLELVGTSFGNYVMPWIRYRIGDVVVPAPSDARCDCGRSLPLIEQIEGRVSDSIVTPDGREVMMAGNILAYIPDVIEGQVRQERPGEVELLLVMARGGQLNIESAKRAVTDHLGCAMQVSVHCVAAVPRTASGKLRPVVRVAASHTSTEVSA
jgi:phenylacetate-CoA ligase